MAKKSKGGKGVSLSPKDKVTGGGLFGAGTATATEHRFGLFDYNGKRKPVTALLVTFERDGEEHIESYTVGNGFKASEDGKYLIPKGGQTGLNDNCKAMLYIGALTDECEMPEDFVSTDISVLDGIVGDLTRKPLEKVEGSDKAGSILVFTSTDEAPWSEGGKKKKKSKKKDEDEEEEEEEDGDDDSDDADDDDDDEDDEKPAKKGKGAKADKADKGKTKGGKKAKSDDEDEDDDDESESDDDDAADEDLTEIATEALLAALEDGPLKTDKIEDAVLAQVKKHKQKKDIAKLAASAKFLKTEAGWSVDGKKVSLD